MRVVFAGTPEVALPALDADRRRPTTTWSASSPVPTRRPGAAASWSPARSRSAPRSSAYPCSSPSTRATPSSRTQLRALAPDCCPVVAYGALLPQSALDIPDARLGQPALLGAARPGAAPRPVQHAIWAGDEVTGATTFRIVKELDAGPTFGVMTETIRPDRHRRRPARPAGRGRRRAAGRDPGRHRRRLPRGARAAGRGGQLRAQDLGRRRADRLDRARRGGRPAGPRLHARPRAPGAPTRASGSRSARSPSTDTRPLEPGRRSRSPRTPSWSAPATHAVRLGEVKAHRKQADGRRRLGPRRTG